MARWNNLGGNVTIERDLPRNARYELLVCDEADDIITKCSLKFNTVGEIGGILDTNNTDKRIFISATMSNS